MLTHIALGCIIKTEREVREMKNFTFNDIREFCKTHYGEYMEEPETAITFDFNAQDFTRKMGFIDLAEGADIELDGVWQYVGHDMFGKNKYIFKFKRIA